MSSVVQDAASRQMVIAVNAPDRNMGCRKDKLLRLKGEVSRSDGGVSRPQNILLVYAPVDARPLRPFRPAPLSGGAVASCRFCPIPACLSGGVVFLAASSLPFPAVSFPSFFRAFFSLRFFVLLRFFCPSFAALIFFKEKSRAFFVHFEGLVRNSYIERGK